ncbi:MAG TPA: hypothetical protein VMK84_19970 [Streptosporangiaceae bacterium]|nr:hypothetical protein [Streptosporangiaceae bacterium]
MAKVHAGHADLDWGLELDGGGMLSAGIVVLISVSTNPRRRRRRRQPGDGRHCGRLHPVPQFPAQVGKEEHQMDTVPRPSWSSAVAISASPSSARLRMASCRLTSAVAAWKYGGYARTWRRPGGRGEAGRADDL